MLSKRDSSKGYVLVKADKKEPREDEPKKKKLTWEEARDESKKLMDDAKARSFQTQRGIARRMLPGGEQPKVRVVDPDREEKQKKFAAEGQKRYEEERPEMAWEKEVDEEEQPEPKDKTPGHEIINAQRYEEMVNLFTQEYKEILSFEATPEEALDDLKNTLGVAFIDSIGASDSAHDFVEAHDRTPIITPAMAEVLQREAERNGLDAEPYAATVKDEQIAHHLGLLNQYKLKRPDKVMEALDWESGRHGDEEDIHPMFAMAGALYNNALETGSYDLEDVKAEQNYRNEKRGWKTQDRKRAEERAQQHFENVPDYVESEESERGHSPHQVALDDAYRQLFEQTNLDDAYEEAMEVQNHTPIEEAVMDAIRATAESYPKLLQHENEQRRANIKDLHSKYRQWKLTATKDSKTPEGMLDGAEYRRRLAEIREPEVDERYNLRLAYEGMQDIINGHASKALNAIGIGAKQKLEFGRTNESGSDPIMTPSWKRIGNALGFKTHFKVNAPDIFLSAPLGGKTFGGEEVNPFDPKYRQKISRQLENWIEDEGKMANLHPAIGRNEKVMRDAVMATGRTDLIEEMGLETGHEGDKKRLDLEGHEAGSIDTQEAGALGTPFGGDLPLGRDRPTGLLYADVTKEQLADMGKTEREAFLKRKQREHHRKFQQFMRTGKGSKGGEVRGKKREDLARLEHHQMMNEVEHYKKLYNAGKITRETYERKVGPILAQKGIENEMEEGPKLEMPEVPEGHYLYADDKTGDVLTADEREEKLAKFMNTVIGVHHILQAAKKKMAKEGEDHSIIHDEGDLMLLMKPPSRRTEDENEKVDAMRAAQLDRSWLSTRLTQNAELRDSIRGLGIHPQAFLEQVGEVFGGEVNYEQLTKGVVGMINQMGRTKDEGDLNDSINRMLYKYLNLRHTQDMQNLDYHGKVIDQQKALRDGTLDEGDHVCAGCIGSSDRVRNVGKNRGGKSGVNSPYAYNLIKVPNLMGVPLGEVATEENPSPEGRGVDATLINIFHDLKGRGDEPEDWEKTERQVSAMVRTQGGEEWLQSRIEAMASKKTNQANRDISKRYGVGAKWIQSKPKGIAADIENNPLAMEVWKHTYPATTGSEHREAQNELQSLIKNQKKDLIGAFNILTLSRRQLSQPQIYDGELSAKSKRKMIREIMKASGTQEEGKARKAYHRFVNDRTRKSSKPDGKDRKVPGYNTKKAGWERMQFPAIEENNIKLAQLKPTVKDMNDEKKADYQKLIAETKKMRDRATQYCKDKDHLGVFGVELNRWRAATKKHSELQNAMINTKGKKKFDIKNNPIATLASLYPQLKQIMKEQGKNPEEGKLEAALDVLHKETYLNENQINKRHRYGFTVGDKGRIKTVKELSHNPLTEGNRGLRGGMGETLGSAINYSGAGYHVPIPTDLDTALAMMHEHGVNVTPEILKELQSAESALKETKAIEDEFADFKEDMREEEKIRANQSYTDSSKKNYSNPTGSQTRCGTCAGNTHLTQDEMISYAKAHNEKLHGHSSSSKDVRRWITNHGRPTGYQSFDEFDAKTMTEVPPMDHNEYACPDCQHWDNQVGGWVSDGICGGCLGDGSVNKDDEHLLEHIENHTHKAGVAMTPEKLRRLIDMQTLRRGELDEYHETKDAEGNPNWDKYIPPSHQLKEPNLTGLTPNMTDELFNKQPLSPLELILGRIKEGELPDIHTREELEAAEKKRLSQTRDSAILQEFKDEEPAEEKPLPRGPPQQTRLPIALTGVGSNALRDARHQAGIVSLHKQLAKMLGVAKKYGLDAIKYEDEDGKKTKHSVFDVINNKVQAIAQYSYEDIENEEHEVHDLLNATQKMINQNVSLGTAQRELLGGDTERYNEIQEMPEGNAKEKALKAYKRSLYKMPSWTIPLLSHSGGRMMTRWELENQDAFGGDREAVHHKTPQDVRDFFVSSNRGKNRIKSAFKLLKGNKWDEIKQEEDKQIMEFLKDFDALIDSGESPMPHSSGGVLPPNSDYLQLRKETGNLVPDDEFDKPLEGGNMLHPNLEKHSKNAENWLRAAKTITDEDGNKTQELRPKSEAKHMEIPNQVAKVAKNEFANMATMRAMKSFFNIQCLPHQDEMPEGMKKILNADGEPMTLQEYMEDGLNREEDSQLQHNISQMIVDKNGNPIEDHEDKTGLEDLKQYFIVNRLPSAHSHNQDLALQEHTFDDYLANRMNDADFKLEPHTSEDYAAKVLKLIQQNQAFRKSKELPDYDMSMNDAQKIVENANKFYDMYHYPNLYLENKMHDLAIDYGLDNLHDLKEVMDIEPELKTQFADDIQMIRSIHPCWSANDVSNQKHMDEAKALHDARTKQTPSSEPSGMQTQLPGAPIPTFSDFFPQVESQVEYEKKLKAATEKHLGLDKPQMVGPTPDEQEMVRVQQAQAAQQPGQQQMVSVMQDQVNPQGEQTGFTSTMRPQ